MQYRSPTEQHVRRRCRCFNKCYRCCCHRCAFCRLFCSETTRVRCCVAWWWCSLITALLVLLVFTSVMTYIISPATYSASCELASRSGPHRFAHRGNTTRYPENSLGALLDARHGGLSSEFDVQVTKDGTFVVFHDSNTLRMTGVDMDVESSTYEELSALPLLPESSGMFIPTVTEVLEALCNESDPLSAVYVDTKIGTYNLDYGLFITSNQERRLEELMDLLGTSPCVAAGVELWVDNSNPFALPTLNRRAERYPDMVYEPLTHLIPGAYPLGELFWLKTRFAAWYAGVDIQGADEDVYFHNEDLVRDMQEDGWCTIVFSGGTGVLPDGRKLDELGAHAQQVEVPATDFFDGYDPDAEEWMEVFLFFVFAMCWILTLVCMYVLGKSCLRHTRHEYCCPKEGCCLDYMCCHGAGGTLFGVTQSLERK